MRAEEWRFIKYVGFRRSYKYEGYLLAFENTTCFKEVLMLTIHVRLQKESRGPHQAALGM